MYSAVVEDHFHRPRRVGPLVAATHKGVAGHPGEGPYVVLWLKADISLVGEDSPVIDQVAYQTFGCPAAIASASVTAEICEGQTFQAARALTEADIVQALAGLPEGKEHCPRLAVAALRNALVSLSRS